MILVMPQKMSRALPGIKWRIKPLVEAKMTPAAPQGANHRAVVSGDWPRTSSILESSVSFLHILDVGGEYR